MEEIKSKPQSMSSLLDGLDWTIPISRLLQISSEPDSRANYPISHLPISSRARVAFLILGVETVSQLLNLTIEEMMAVRRFGLRSVHHTIQVLEHFLQTTLVRDNSNQGERYDAPSYNKRSLSSATLCTESFELVNDLDWDAPLQTILPYRSDHYSSCNYPITVLGLSVRSQNGLNNLEIATIDELLSSNVRRLMNIRHMGLRSVWNILQCINHFYRTGLQENPVGISVLHFAQSDGSEVDAIENTSSENSIPHLADNRKNDIILCLGDDTKTLVYDLIVAQLNPKHLSALQVLGISDLNGLMGMELIDSIPESERSVTLLLTKRLNQFNHIAWTIATEIGELVDRKAVIIRFYELHESQEPDDCLLNPTISGKLGLRLSAVLSSKLHQLKVAQLWFNPCTEKSTLKRLGDSISVTRERARQVIIKVEERMRLHPGFMEWAIREMYDEVERHGGIIGATELEATLFRCPPCHERSGHGRFVEFAEQVLLWNALGLSLNNGVVRAAKVAGETFDVVRRVLVSVSQSCADDVPGPHLWSCSMTSVKNELIRRLKAEGDSSSQQLSLSLNTIKLVATEMSEFVRVQNDRLYSSLYWNLRFGSRVQQVEAILLTNGRSMHHSEILSQMVHWSHNREKALKSDVGGVFERADNVLLWGRGTYIHRALVNIPYELLQSISIVIDNKLSGGVQYLSIAKLYDQFQESCLASGLPNRQALYSALRVVYSTRLGIKEYPYITSINSSERRVPLSFIIEEYIRSNGGYVKRDELERYLTNDFGIDDKLVHIHIGATQNILSASGRCIHADNLQVNRNVLSDLINICLGELENRKQLSINEIIRTRKVMCVQIGVEDPRLIHSLVMYDANGILAGTYPHVTKAETLESLQSVSDIVDKLIKTSYGPFSVTELRNYLVEELSFTESTLQSALNQPSIVKYSSGSYIHVSTIGWSMEKQVKLDEIAHDVYEAAHSTNKLFATIAQIFHYREYELPDLDDFVWTETLINSMLKRSSNWIFLGNANNAYVPLHGTIQSLDDLVTAYITNIHYGACSLAELEEELRDLGVIVKHLTQEMLGTSSNTVIDGRDVYLRRLFHAH